MCTEKEKRVNQYKKGLTSLLKREDKSSWIRTEALRVSGDGSATRFCFVFISAYLLCSVTTGLSHMQGFYSRGLPLFNFSLPVKSLN